MVFLCNDMDSEKNNATVQCCTLAGFFPIIAYATTFPQLIEQTVCSGRGVSLISKATVDNQEVGSEGHRLNPDVVFRPIKESYCVRHYGIALSSTNYHPKALRLYLQKVFDALGLKKSFQEIEDAFQ